jgi:CBS domain-containing protein
MKTSKSSVFIAGIDDVEKVFSYPHPPVKQMEYQVEVPLLARSDKTHMVIVYPEAFVESPTSNTIQGPVLLPAHLGNVCFRYTVTPITLKYISIQIRTELMDRLMFCFTCRSPPRFPDCHFSGVTDVTHKNILGIVSIGDLVKAKLADQGFIIEQMERYIHS